MPDATPPPDPAPDRVDPVPPAGPTVAGPPPAGPPIGAPVATAWPPPPAAGPAVLPPWARHRAATPAELATVGATGIVVAALVPGARAGIGAAVAALAVTVTVLALRWRAVRRPTPAADAGTAPGRTPPPEAEPGTRPDRASRILWSALALALAALPVWTDARWVLAVTSVAAVGLAALAVTGPRTWRGVAVAALAPVPAIGAAAASGAAALGGLVAGGAGRVRRLRTAAITAALVLVFGALFVSADAVFADVLAGLLVPDLAVGPVLQRAAVAVAVATATGGFVLLRRLGDASDRAAAPPARTLVGSEWTTPLAALVVLFAAFLAVQASTLFTDHATVLATPGLTYADAAREGFAQLLVVAVLTLVVVAVVGRYVAVRGRGDERLRRVLLATLCLETLAVLASALQRLVLYEEAFGFTRARLVAHATLLWLAALFVLVLVLGAARRTTALPRVVVAVTALGLLAGGVGRPDALVAAGNVARFERTGDLDPGQLAALSADAAPITATLPAEVRRCVADAARDRAPGIAAAPDASWRAWNLARARADRLAPPPPGTAVCPPS